MKTAATYKILGFTLSFGLLTSCAGPTNPWGHYGVTLPTNSSPLPVEVRGLASLESKNSKARIHFFPRRQNFHATTEFQVVIEENNPIPGTAKLALFYNGTDVTNQWLSKSHVETNQAGNRMTLTFHGVKLLAQREHDIRIYFKKDAMTEAKISNYPAPSCFLSALEPLGSLGRFQSIDKSLRNAIEGISSQEGVNPSFVAGLIAQESAFNPVAVSHAKAIGLTQVTQGAEKHILDTYQDFPSFPLLNELPVPFIKTMILSGKVNQENEWRLDPSSSIRGGIHYLKFVENYWLKDENHKAMLKHYETEDEILDDLILASYNSGPYRVKKELNKHGRDWINSEHLGEARKYVRRVKSYCYHFAANNSNRYKP